MSNSIPKDLSQMLDEECRVLCSKDNEVGYVMAKHRISSIKGMADVSADKRWTYIRLGTDKHSTKVTICRCEACLAYEVLEALEV